MTELGAVIDRETGKITPLVANPAPEQIDAIARMLIRAAQDDPRPMYVGENPIYG